MVAARITKYVRNCFAPRSVLRKLRKLSSHAAMPLRVRIVAIVHSTHCCARLTVGLRSICFRTLSYLHEIRRTDPPGKSGLNLLRREAEVFTRGFEGLGQRELVRSAQDQTISDAVHAGLRQRNLL